MLQFEDPIANATGEIGAGGNILPVPFNHAQDFAEVGVIISADQLRQAFECILHGFLATYFRAKFSKASRSVVDVTGKLFIGSNGVYGATDEILDSVHAGTMEALS